MKKLGEYLLQFRQMNMNASVMRKDNPKRFWTAFSRLVLGLLFFGSMFLHFYNFGFGSGTPVNAFYWPSVDWLYILVYVGMIIVYYIYEFSNDPKASLTFKIHTVLAIVHFLSMLKAVIFDGTTIRFWAFVQLLVVILMVFMAYFPNLIMKLFFDDNKAKKLDKSNSEDIQDGEFTEVDSEEQ